MIKFTDFKVDSRLPSGKAAGFRGNDIRNGDKSFLRKQESNLDKNAGFTIAEVLMASVVMVLVLGVIIAVYVMLQGVWVEEVACMNLQRQARGAMEQMVRFAVDKENMIWYPAIRAASSADDSISGQIKLDNDTRRFYLSGTEIMYDPDTLTSDDEFCIVENVSGLTFFCAGGIVTINLNMTEQISGKTVNVDLSTKVRLRNVS